MSKITPGPWVKEYVENYDAFRVMAKGDDGHPIEICFSINNEYDVNAIAALPDLIEAAEPFVEFAENNTDEDGWTSNTHHERISDWFGPSEFRALRSILSSIKGREAK